MKGENVPLIQPNPDWPPVWQYPDLQSWAAAADFRFGPTGL